MQIFIYCYSITICVNSSNYDHSVLNYLHSNKNKFCRKLLGLRENSRYSIFVFFI